jgi:GNAT superfamily N-acetyltransferase
MSSKREESYMFAPQLFVVRRCDGFYRFWHDVADPAPISQARAVFDRLTRGGTQNITPHDPEYYEIFAADPLPGWRDGRPPLVRRLFQHDAPAIGTHLLGLDADDRRLRFFRVATDAQIHAYVQDIDWDHSLILGAIRADNVVGMAEALLDRSAPPRHAEIAVSVDTALRGQGLGRFLVAGAIDRAALLGVSQTNLSFLRENRPMQRIIRTLGGDVDMKELVGMIPMPAGTANADARLAA